MTEWSEIEFAEVKDKTRLISAKNIQPLKILNPESHSNACHVVLSSYGGGVVSGDNILINVVGGKDATFLISSQANTKIFRSNGDLSSGQILKGWLEEGAFGVMFPDPIVPQEKSRYKQSQHWDIAGNGLLLIVDWLHSGRMDIGEQYIFESFFSEIKVAVEGKTLLLDRFSFDPGVNVAQSPANFGHYHTVLSAYLVGDRGDERFQMLGKLFLDIKKGSSMSAEVGVCSITKAKENVYVLRAMAKDRMAIQPLCDQIMEKLADEALLGFNSLKRKY